MHAQTGQTGPTRRALLAATAAGLPVLLAACKGVQALGTPPPPPHDITVLRGAISAEQALVDSYSAAIGHLTASPSGPDTIDRLRAVLAEHRQHLLRLRARLIEPAGVTPPATPSPRAVVGSARSVLSQLEQAEQAASDRLIGQVTQVPPALAQLFASIAAAEATHVPYLRAAQPGR